MREIVLADEAPRPVGPYSQAVADGRVVYCSGQIGLEPSTGKLAGDGVAEQTDRCLKNLEAVLAKAGCSLHDVVKTTIFVTDIADLKQVNEAYGRFFAHEPPARSAMAVAALPLGARVEIEAIANRP